MGFGFSLVAAPLLYLLDPRLVPAPVLTALLVLASLSAWRDRGHVDRGGLAWALVGRLPGTVVGLVVLGLLSPRALGVATGLLILTAVALSASRKAPQPARGSLLGAGVVSGVMETTSGVGGPVVALLYRRRSPAQLRGTMAAFFVVGVSISLLGLVLSGNFSSAQARLALLLMPGLLAGATLARPLVPLAARHGGLTVLVLSGVSGTLVLVRSALG